MLALPELLRDDRPAYRPYRALLARIEPLSPTFRRLTFSSPEFEFFAPHGLDQRIKLLFPIAGRISELGDDGSWVDAWRALPDAERNPMRTYTVRAIRPEAREIDIDFVFHGDGGPAARWLTSATPGSELVIVGPDARSLTSTGGIDWHPGEARELLLAGDETAAPAICSILESLPAHVRARAFIAVPHAADALPVVSAADVEVTWLGRDSADRDLETAVREWAAASRAVYAPALARSTQELADVDVDVELIWDAPDAPQADFYAWIAGESAMIKSLRRYLVSDLGIDRKRVAFMGYWRLGKAEN
jgi:NADPH-dependent ferric siderophore reductase